MNPVYAITSHTEISYGEQIGFLRYKIYILENTSCSKIYHVEKKLFFSVFQYKIMFISYHSNMSEKQDIYFSFFFFYHFFRILSRIFEFSKIRHLNIKQNVFYTASGNLREGSEI